MLKKLVTAVAPFVLCLGACARGLPTPVSAAAPAPTGSLAALAATYNLVAIDGHTIPFAPTHTDVPPSAPPGPEVLASTLRLRADGTFLMAMSYRSLPNGTQRFFVAPFSGSYGPVGDDYLMTWDGAGRTRVSVRGDTLFLNNEGIVFAYRRGR